ncbi:MAG: peroxiredoxin [Saprospiraceae bacterium]|nr:peroxiredoxin [Saprospiraceae bacterium]
MAKVKKGDSLPDFSLKDQNNHEVRSIHWIGKPVVVFFYPDDNTPICTAQVCLFRNNYHEFQKLGIRVVGISHNSSKSHSNFASQHQLPFLLLSDKNDEVRNLFGVPKRFFGLTPGRVTYVFDRDGKLIYINNSFMNAAKHVKGALDVLKNNL